MPFFLIPVVAGAIAIKVGIGLAAGTAGIGIGAAGLKLWQVLFGDEPNFVEERKELQREHEERDKKRMDELDDFTQATMDSTQAICDQMASQTKLLQQSTQSIAHNSTILTEESATIQELADQVKVVIQRQHQKLQEVSYELQQQTQSLPEVSNGLNETQVYLTERQGEITDVINLLAALLLQLEGRHHEWLDINETLQALKGTNSENQEKLADVTQFKNNLISEVKELNNQLGQAMLIIKQHEATQESYKAAIAMLQEQLNNSQSSISPRFFGH
jgi:ABC-type transporter Mla subunit MlaD